MRVKVKRRKMVEEEVEVTFPVFYKSGDTFDDGGSYDTIYRIESDGNTWSVTKREHRFGHVEYEFDTDKINVEHQLAQYLGGSDSLGYVSTEAEFAKLVTEVRAALAAFPV